MTTRSAKHACGKPMQTNPDKLASGNRGSGHKEDEINEEDPTQDIPDWLQPFTDNLEDVETHVPAHSSEREISDSEGHASKVATQKRKHCISSHFTKDPNCDTCLRTKITRVPCRRLNEGSISRAEKFGDLITADHKSPQRRKVNLETITDTQSWYKILPLHGFNLFRAKQKLRRRRRRVYENF